MGGLHIVTTDPAPTKEYFPIVTLHTIVQLAPNVAPLLTNVSRYSSLRAIADRGLYTLVNTALGPQKNTLF